MDFVRPIIVQHYIPEPGPRRVLLFNPPVYDIRFPWSRWQQPVTLLQLATLLRNQCQVRLIDTLYVDPNSTLTKHRMRILDRGGVSINYWRFGQPQSELLAQLESLSSEGWYPDDVYLEGFTTFWWEGVVEAISLVREKFPQARIVLYGAYSSLATEHARMHSGADIVVIGPIEGLAGLPLDLSLYPKRPLFTYLSIGTEQRPSNDILDEILSKAGTTNSPDRTRQFAFVDHNAVRNYPQQFRSVLKAVIDRKLKVSFYALGNIYARDLVDDPELPSLLFRAGFKQLVFADDRGLPSEEEAREEFLYLTHHAVARCVAVGYKWRTESLAASVCIGRPGEKISDVTAFVTKLAHLAGSLIVVPYQPSPLEFSAKVSPELQNGKLFPFAESNNVSYRIYQDLLGLAAVLNAKYRSHTFDFLGDGLISRLVQSSLVSGTWNPHTLLDAQREQPITVGWINKEGKWVRS